MVLMAVTDLGSDRKGYDTTAARPKNDHLVGLAGKKHLIGSHHV